MMKMTLPSLSFRYQSMSSFSSFKHEGVKAVRTNGRINLIHGSFSKLSNIDFPNQSKGAVHYSSSQCSRSNLQKTRNRTSTNMKECKSISSNSSNSRDSRNSRNSSSSSNSNNSSPKSKTKFDGIRNVSCILSLSSSSLLLSHLLLLSPLHAGELTNQNYETELTKAAVKETNLNLQEEFHFTGVDLEVSAKKWMEYHIPACKDASPCVSTSSFQSPSRFLPPWSFLENRTEAFQNLRKVLIQMGAKCIYEEKPFYMHYKINYDENKGNNDDDYDDLEFLFKREGTVLFRSISNRFTPDPPFCFWKGCINGPKNRYRLESIRDELGWVSLETDEEKKWVPLLFH